jgi:phosphatidylglycerol lysyltransferase
MRKTCAGAPTTSPAASPKDRERVLALLRRHGRDAVSFQILEPGLRYWFADDACVAYAPIGRAWVAAGGPIAARDAEVAVMTGFAAAARAAGCTARFFGIERDVSREAPFDVLAVGVQPVWDPRAWPRTLAAHRSLREQVRRARNKDVAVRLAAPGELRPGTPLRAAVDGLIARWLCSRAMAPMRFVVALEPYGFPAERRFLVAERRGALAGILIAVPIYARGGYLLEDVLRDPAAPNGTVELLFDAAMRTLDGEGCDHATFGLIPLAGVDSRLLRAVRRLGRPLYDFEGLLHFKHKLDPSWQHPVYVAYPRGDRPLAALLDVLRAFAGGSLLRFAVATERHRAPDLAWLLAILLVPWIALLALARTEVWFPSQRIQLAWIALDLGILGALLALARSWRKPLAIGLAAVALGDFGFGLWQALAWNLARVPWALELVAIVGALAAPLGAAAFLWLARDHRPLPPAPPGLKAPARPG